MISDWLNAIIINYEYNLISDYYKAIINDECSTIRVEWKTINSYSDVLSDKCNEMNNECNVISIVHNVRKVNKMRLVMN